jgi:hypothetical protein
VGAELSRGEPRAGAEDDEHRLALTFHARHRLAEREGRPEVGEEVAAVLERRELPKREKLVISTYVEKNKASKVRRRVASISASRRSPQ